MHTDFTSQIILAIAIAAFLGYTINAARLVVECDWEAPYRCEAVRGIGLVFPPVGAIVGYMGLDN